MSVSYFVSYRGPSSDEAAFYRRYREVHAPILGAMPGIAALVLHRPVAWHDPYPVNSGGLQLLAQMVFPSAEALDRALASEARKAARADFAHFPPVAGPVLHQAMQSETVFGAPLLT